MIASSEIVQACLALGFSGAGVCRAEPASRPDSLKSWIDQGRHGSMDWLAEYMDQRLDVRTLIPGRAVRSVIMVADAYAAPTEEAPIALAPGSGRVSKYARGHDYHRVIRRRLHQLADRLRTRASGEEFRSFVDTGPVLEREHAARAGLGFIGKHTLLIDLHRGSYLLLGGIATTLELEPTGSDHSGSDHCGHCTRCIDACPTQAIEPYLVDARRCISYLTIEHEGPIEVGLQRRMGEWIFGCDVCQDVCPFNQASHGRSQRINAAYHERPALAAGVLDLGRVMNWSAEDRRVTLTVSAGKRATLEMLRRNAIIAAGNSLGKHDEPGLRAEIARIATDPAESGLVRQTAAEALVRSTSTPSDRL